MVGLRTVVLSVATLAASAVAQLAIATPASVVECQPASLSITPGTAPYYISILPGGQVSAAALEQLPTTSSTTLTWTCDIAAGTSITFQIRDSTGTLAYSAPITVQAGGSTSCLGTNASGGASSAVASTPASSAAQGSSSVASVASSSAASVSRSASSAASSVASVASSSASRAASSAASASGSVAASASASAKSGAQQLAVSGVLGFLAAAVAAF